MRLEVARVRTASPAPSARPTIADYEVAYVIISGPGRHRAVDSLPFFSLVNLANTAKDLQALGFTVTVDVVGTL